MIRARLALALSIVVLVCTPALATAEAWVKDEVRLNLRTGPGSKYRITGAIRTGDSVTVLDRREGWTHVRLDDARDGWVPAGFLSDEPPAMTRVGRMEHENRELRDALSNLRQEVDGLRQQRDTLETTEADHRSRAQALEAENLELKAGARWPEWITGAGILATGMLVGSLLQSWSSRRPRSRIRL